MTDMCIDNLNVIVSFDHKYIEGGIVSITHNGKDIDDNEFKTHEVCLCKRIPYLLWDIIFLIVNAVINVIYLYDTSHDSILIRALILIIPPIVVYGLNSLFIDPFIVKIKVIINNYNNLSWLAKLWYFVYAECEMEHDNIVTNVYVYRANYLYREILSNVDKNCRTVKYDTNENNKINRKFKYYKKYNTIVERIKIEQKCISTSKYNKLIMMFALFGFTKKNFIDVTDQQLKFIYNTKDKDLCFV